MGIIKKKMFDEDWKKRFANTYEFSNHDINKLIFLLWKGVYLYKDMNDGRKFGETSLPEKEDFLAD